MERQICQNSAVLVVTLMLSLIPAATRAHCDSLDGPVVSDARLALGKGDPTPVLKWVKPDQEDEIRAVFEQALVVRAGGTEAKALADRFFYETLVRIHRAGEGEGFTGLKPANAVDPGIAAADKALQSSSAEELGRQLSAAVDQGVRARLATVLERKKHRDESVEAGRSYVEAYVDYIHFVETINRIATQGAPRRHHDSVAAEE